MVIFPATLAAFFGLQRDTKLTTDAFQRGRDDFLGRNANPYPAGSADARQWDAGHQDAWENHQMI